MTEKILLKNPVADETTAFPFPAEIAFFPLSLPGKLLFHQFLHGNRRWIFENQPQNPHLLYLFDQIQRIIRLFLHSGKSASIRIQIGRAHV